jgi:hypothetical protein
MQTKLKELNELKASFEKLNEVYKTKMETKAAEPSDMEKMMYEMISYVHQRINRFQDDMYSYMYDHQKGHLPAIKDAGMMEDCLKKMGLGNSFEVRKPVIYANTKYGIVAEVPFAEKKV